MESSEGVQVEYLAIFVAILFPGALVAFNLESLHALQRISALRIYCAGIWHNAVVRLQSLCQVYIACMWQCSVLNAVHSIMTSICNQ